jgi:uncharacterized repeat protein (TIGR01451 family)
MNAQSCRCAVRILFLLIIGLAPGVFAAIGPSNNPPVAVNDTVTVTTGATNYISVLANDYDPDFDPLSINSFTAPAHGSVYQSATQLVYQSFGGYCGPDSFNYQITDNRGGFSSNATVSITVTGCTNSGSNGVIQFTASAYGRFENQAANINVERTGDTTANASVQWMVTGGTATAGSDYTGGTNGTLTFAPGQILTSLPITIVDDLITEPDETVSFFLFNPTNASLGSTSFTTLTIFDNDVAASADLQITKTVNSNSVTVGQIIVFQLGLFNFGPNNVTNSISVNEAIPSGFQYVSDTSAASGTTYSAGLGLWTIPNGLGSGSNIFLTITVQAINTGTYTNRAIINVPNGVTDPNTNNNSVSAIITVTNAPPTQAELQITKTASVSTLPVGSNVVFNLVLRNNGPGTVTNQLVVTEVIPPGFDYVGDNSAGTGSYYSFGLGQWVMPTGIVAGAMQTVAITVRAITAGTYTNTAIINVPNGVTDPNTNNNSASVTVTVTGGMPPSTADLLLIKSADSDFLTVSHAVTFEIYIQNDGPDDATNVVVQEYLPPGLVIISNSPTAGTYNSISNQWTISSLPNGANATLSLTVVSYSTGTFSNVAAITAAGASDPEPGNNTSGAAVTWTPPSADLEVIKSASPTYVNAGEQIEFTLLVDNAGPDGASSVMLQDVLPPGLAVVNITASQGACSYNGGTVSCSLGSLSNGASASVTILVTATQGGVFTNTATAAAQETDPVPSNNSGSAVYVVQREFMVTASAGPNGMIAPAGTASYTAGSLMAFYATPAVNYIVDSWYLDGVLVQTGGGTYTLYNIEADHTVYVTFRFVPPCQGLAVNFVDLFHGDDDSLAGDAIAGAFPQEGWINALGPSGNLFTQDGITVNWSASTTRSLFIGNLSPDHGMMQGYLDSGSNQTVVTIGGITYASYDVYVYAAGDNTAASPTGGNETRVGRYTLGAALKYAKDDPAASDFSGSFVESASTSGGAGASNGNYVVFQNVSGASFTLTAASDYTSGSTRSAPVNGIQVVPHTQGTNSLLRFTSIVRSNQNVFLTLAGQANSYVDIESSEDLVQWVPVATRFNTNGTLKHTDVLDPDGPVRFYRASQGGVPREPNDMTFVGSDADSPASQGALTLRGDLNQMQFSWSSFDPLFGQINTGWINASNWNVVPGAGNCPARLTFSGVYGGILFYGSAFFDAYQRVVIEMNRQISNTVQRGRYSLIRVTLNMTLYRSDGVTPLEQSKEIKQGGYLPVNNDDDNRNGLKDKNDDDGEGGEDDMLRLELTRPLPPLLQQKGLLYLRKVNAGTNDNSSRVKIWKHPQKGATNLVLAANQREKTWDLSVPAQRNDLASMLTNLWVEGVAGSAMPRDVELQWAYRDSALETNDVAREVIRLTVIEFQTQASQGLDGQNRVFTAWSTTNNRGEAPAVTLATRVVQQNLPKDFLVRWYAHDYDDPAKHVHADPNDKFAKEPRLPKEKAGYQPPEVGGYRANWRDNSGIVTAAAMFEEKTGFAINGGVKTYSQKETVPAAIGGADRPVLDYTWVEAETKTALDAGRNSKIIFNATDNRGDNFLIHVGFDFDGFSFLCHLQQDTTMGEKPLTVWTKQQVVVYAMNRAIDPNRVVIVPGPNGIIEPGYDARDQITGGVADARKARVVIGAGNTELFSRPRGNDRILGFIEPKTAADGLNPATVAAIHAMDILRGTIVGGADGKLAKATVLSGGRNDDHSMLKIEKGTNGMLDTPVHTNDMLNGAGEIVPGADGILDSAANLAGDDIITGTIQEGTDGKLDSRPANGSDDIVMGTIQPDGAGVLHSRPVPDTDAGRKDRLVGFIDSGNPTGAKAGNPDDTCLDIKPGYLRNSQRGATADDNYVWVGGKPVIVAGPDGDCDTLAVADDVNILAPGDDGVYYPFDGGENLGTRFDYMKKTYSQLAGTESWGYMDLNIYDATNRASYASDFTHYEDTLGNGYGLADGQTLILKLDGGAAQTITFRNADFADITKATTAEIVAVINSTVAGLARSLPYNRNGVSSHLCLRSATSIEVTGGTALGGLGFAVEKVTRNHTRFTADIADGTTKKPVQLPALLEYEMYFRGQSDVHGSDAKDPPHPSDVVSIYGVRSDDNNGTFGATDRQPHSLINVGLHEQKGIIRNDTVCHEPGHSWATPGQNVLRNGKDPFHQTHTTSTIAGGVVTYNDTVIRGSDSEPCQWSNKQGNDSGALCPWHIRQLRNSMYRTWNGTDTYGNRD